MNDAQRLHSQEDRKMASRRLLFVVNDVAFLLSHRLGLALAARDAGFDVHIAAGGTRGAEALARTGLAFHPLPISRRGTMIREELAAIAALVDLYRKLGPDLVHHVTAKAIVYGGIAAHITRVPAVVHAVSGLGYVFIADDFRAGVLRTAIRASHGLVTSHPNCAVIFQNDDDRRAFGRAIRARRIAMIRGSGVDLSRFRLSPIPHGDPLVILPARMLRDKGVCEFVDAARVLRKKHPSARFCLVGGVDPGNPAMLAREQLDAWVREGVVEWWGHRTDMPEVFAAATVVCLPSYREGMPLALIEASATGRPIVTTDVPGCRDVVNNRPFGILVPARNSRALADALDELLSDERSRLETMGLAASQAAREFAIENVVAATLGLYRELLDWRPG